MKRSYIKRKWNCKSITALRDHLLKACRRNKCKPVDKGLQIIRNRENSRPILNNKEPRNCYKTKIGTGLAA
jgi:hypothetical protein